MSELRGLGKGLRALIPETAPRTIPSDLLKVPMESIHFNTYQPRQQIDESKVVELADSIRSRGLIYPLLVRKSIKSGVDGPIYELIAGERRLRALKLLGETEAPVIIREAGDRDALELALIENLQREELNPMEQAAAYQRLVSEFSLTQEQVAGAVGKNRATVANTVRLLKLAPSVQGEVSHGRLSLGHARALLALEGHRSQSDLAQRIVHLGLSVRQTERVIQETNQKSEKKQAVRGKDPHLQAMEQKLQRSLGTNVQIFHGKTRGWIRIAYYSLKDLDRLAGRLT
jgi:ParB family transcriptional regulator, chromosome partitioning protein